ncbi:MAG UNVERIFIED_CONTAM: hypothetical protein LVR18_48615 [Planctomycetaceae bacterium]
MCRWRLPDSLRFRATLGFEQEKVGSTTKIKLAATNVNAFLGSNPDNVPISGDEVGAQVSDALSGGCAVPDAGR